MFADFAGYSRLHDASVPLFQQSFFEIGALLIEQTGIRVLEAKTWGDALYAVFAFTRWGGIRVAVSRTHEGRQLDVDLAYREKAMCESPCTPDPCFVRTIL